MKARLRGHHLICLHFYKGRGYSEGFVNNLNEILKRAKDEGIYIITGSDEVCKACPYLAFDSCNLTENADEEIRQMDNLALELLNMQDGIEIKWQILSNKIPKIINSWKKRYCFSCQWKEVCEINETV
ncbi:MAG TPA: DUF1284 domain-containing protein [Nitrospirae bacterium]|nr:DUF1284 domain-containing protein [Nitrospirota bacterium]